MSALRKSGIDVLGDIPWGSHFCNFYETKQDLLDTLVPYFKAGLENKEYCLWVVSNSVIKVEEAKEALKQAVPDLGRHLSEKNIEILQGADWYLEENVFNLEGVTRAWDVKLKQALASGHEGMRVSGDTFWLTEKEWKDFYIYEENLNNFITDLPMTALCTYPLIKSEAIDILDVVHVHQFAIARRRGQWEIIESPELMQAKAEIKKLNEELEQRVAERTKELAETNKELRKEIAERKHAEALLNAKEQEFRAIVENAPDLIARYDREFRRTYVNPAFNKSYDMSTETLIGKAMFSIIREAGLDVKEDELTKVRQLFADVFETGTSHEFEITLPFPAGGRNYNVRLFPELDVNGSVINVLSIARDITENKRAEEELKKEKEILKKIFDNIPVMIGFVGEDGGVKLVNPEWERTIGWTLKELQKQNVDIFAEAYPDLSYRRKVLNFVAAATGEWMDLKIKVRDGRVIDAACTVVQLSDGTKIAIAQDITERKQAEETLKQSYEEIRRLTEHLQKIREEERRSIAREIHDELGQQLTAIKMDVVWIDKKLPGEVSDIKRKLKNIIALLDGSDQSIRKILSELRPKILDDHGLLEAIKWLGRRFTETTRIPVVYTTTDEEIKVSEQVATCMFRVCQEAFTNITRYSQAKKVSISIRIFEKNIKLIIEDDGVGFDTASVQNKNSFGILGMKERVLSLGGAFELVSSPGKGTKITASLPYDA